MLVTRSLLGLDVNILDFGPANQRLLPSITTKTLCLRTILSVHWIWDAYVILVTFHDIFAIIFVSLLRWDSPEEWPPLFGSVGEAYTLRRFWGVFWHRLHLAPFELLMRPFLILQDPAPPMHWNQNHGSFRPDFWYKLLRALSIFLLSAICHIGVDWVTAGNRNTLSELRFFLSNFCICLAEKFVHLTNNYLTDIISI
ncbi:membrane bound O-acyl transferase family-domain-containing protein [Xylaria longipes]|nr:membrane bound O-acyl transferase family-domain-containing protein [Xylaria longipes]